MSVYIYIYTHVYIYIYVYIYTYVCVCDRAAVHVHEHVQHVASTRLHARESVHMYGCNSLDSLFLQLFMYVYCVVFQEYPNCPST